MSYNFSSMTVRQLRQFAKDNHISDYSAPLANGGKAGLIVYLEQKTSTLVLPPVEEIVTEVVQPEEEVTFGQLLEFLGHSLFAWFTLTCNLVWGLGAIFGKVFFILGHDAKESGRICRNWVDIAIARIDAELDQLCLAVALL